MKDQVTFPAAEIYLMPKQNFPAAFLFKYSEAFENEFVVIFKFTVSGKYKFKSGVFKFNWIESCIDNNYTIVWHPQKIGQED